jgi:hypothetical protein
VSLAGIRIAVKGILYQAVVLKERSGCLPRFFCGEESKHHKTNFNIKLSFPHAFSGNLKINKTFLMFIG